jgi:hypothetical protein
MHFDACNYESASWAVDHENEAVGILVSVHRLPCELTTIRRALSILPVLKEIGSTQEKKIAVGCVAHNLRYAA